jgi:hypothetical protein
MKSVFIVWHTHETESQVDEKLIGVYATRNDADGAVDRLSCKPGFKDSSDGFEISEYVLGQDHWTEGYISWAEAMHADDSRTD